jgi:hypothetical protein
MSPSVAKNRGKTCRQTDAFSMETSLTLVVAKKTTHQIIILSDTRIHSPSQERGVGDVKNGSLKTTFLSSDIAVAFTGDPDLANEAVTKIRQQGNLGFRAVIQCLEVCTSDSENEYIAGFAGPKRLFHIAKGKAKETGIAWIGDKAAFERFQSGPISRPAEDFSRAVIVGPDVLDANLLHDQIARFQEVVEASDVPSVGDFFTVAVSDRGKFRFPLVATLYYDSEGRILGPDGARILSATGENRFRFAVWSPCDASIAAAAFVFPEVKRAFVFCSSRHGFSDECTVFDGLEGDLLSQAIEKELGVKFEVTEVRHVPFSC